MNINLELPSIIPLLTITLILIIPLTIPIIHNKLKKYNNRKHDKLDNISVDIDINNILNNIIGGKLRESGMDKDKVKLLIGIISKGILYIRNNKSDCSNEIKVKECLEIIKSLAWEMDIWLNYDEEILIREIVRVGIGI